jgi:hypothetical protein
MKWFQNIILFFLSILVYLHIFIQFKINPENEFITIDDIHKENIVSATYYKLPFVFDGTGIIKPVDLKQCIKIDTNKTDKKDAKDKTYSNLYEDYPILEPGMKLFKTKDTVYQIKKDKTIMQTNLESLNYYIIHSGKVQVYCIHPKYKEYVNVSEEFLENDNILKVELHPNSILFVPNYWYVCVKGLDKSILEKIQYKTPFNHLNFYYEFITNYFKTKLYV